MRILHTADWHLGKRLGNFSRIEEQKLVLKEIENIANKENVDIILIAGDLFDTFNPTVEATELLYSTLKRLSNNGTRPVIAIAGNHDSPDRIEAPDPLAKACGILFAGYPNTEIAPFEWEDSFKITQSAPGFIELKLPKYAYTIRILLTPFANEMRLKTFLGMENEDVHLNEVLQNNWHSIANEYCDNKGVNFLMAHLFVMQKGVIPPEEPDDERPINIGTASAIYTNIIPDQIQYTALGHLHRGHSIDGAVGTVNYSGSPLSYSFSEAGQQKFVRLIDAEPDQPIQIQNIPLNAGRKLHRKKFESVDEAVLWLVENPYTLVELTIRSDQYMTAEERKSLNNAHDGIVMIIPEMTGKSPLQNVHRNINLNEDMDILFQQYFLHKKGQMPSEEILELFKEINH